MTETQAKNTSRITYSERSSAPGKWRIEARDGATLVAAIVIRATSDAEIFDVAALGVEKDYRGQGIARELHKRAHTLALVHGARLRVLQTPNPIFSEVWQKLRAQRVELEGGEFAPGVSALDRPAQSKGEKP